MLKTWREEYMFVIRHPFSVTNFQLSWRMTFTFRDGSSDPITVAYPLTVEFQIDRIGNVTGNKATFIVYNLNRATRDLICKSAVDKNQYHEKIEVIFEAGYGDSLSVVYHGLISECNSYKESSSPDIRTEIYCYDDAVLKYINKTYSKDTSVKQIIKDVATVCNVKSAEIGDFKTFITIPYTMSGRAIDELNMLTGSSIYMDNMKLMALLPNEVLNDTILHFDSSSIFGTPKREGKYLKFNTKFCPEIMYTQLIEVISDIQPQYNGIMKCMGIRHVGSISAGVPCSVETEITGLYGDKKDVLPLNITEKPIRTADNSEVNITKSNKNNQYVKIKDDELMPIGELYSISLEQICEDIQKNGKNAKSLSKNMEISGTSITWSQVIQPDNFRYNELPKLDDIKNVFDTTYWLADFIRKNLGTSALRGLVITSGWRNKGNNDSLDNSSPNSLHLEGRALDFKFVSGIKTDQAWSDAFVKWKYGYTYLNTKTYPHTIHIQIGSSKPDKR
jgi:uncharacterized protein YcbK (DUF882 family)